MKSTIPLYQTYRKRLSQSDLFQGLPIELLDDMLSHFRFETWNKNTVRDSRIVTRRFYLILQGRMELLQIHPKTGKQLVLMLLKEGDIYDVLSLLDGQQHDLIPKALDELQLLSAPLNEVRQWVAEHPRFNKNFLPYLAKRIRIREDLITDLGLVDSKTRLARLVLRYIEHPEAPDRHEVTTGIDVSLLHDLSNEQLGEMVGCTRQVVNRNLQLLKKKGILHIENNHLIIDDLHKLKNHADLLQLAYVN